MEDILFAIPLSVALPLAVSVGGGLARKFLAPKLNLEDAKFDIGRARQGISSQVGSALAKTTADIKGFGAAGRLSKGATLSGISGAVKNATKTISEGEGRLSELQNRANQRIAFARESNKQQTFQDIFNLSLAGVGTLSKVALLKDAGLLNPDGQANSVQGAGGGEGGIGGITGDSDIDLSNIDEDLLEELLGIDGSSGPLSGINVDQLKGRLNA